MKAFLIFVGILLLNCQPQQNLPIDLVTGELISCVNTPNNAFCFESPPQSWAHDSKDVNLALFRSKEKVVVAGRYHVCMDSGVCWGNADLWSADIAEEVLRPFETTRYKSIKSANFLSCGLTIDGDVECWGKPAGLPGFGIAEPLGRKGRAFLGIAMSGSHVCGWHDSGLECWSLAGLSNSFLPGKSTEYGEACLRTNYICARRLAESSIVDCWSSYAQTSFNNVKEFGCGNHACFLSDQVSCMEGPGMGDFGKPIDFALSLTALGVAERHFCGVTADSGLVCRTLTEAEWDPLGLTPWIAERVVQVKEWKAGEDNFLEQIKLNEKD